jgi:hypothetical protein
MAALDVSQVARNQSSATYSSSFLQTVKISDIIGPWMDNCHMFASHA